MHGQSGAVPPAQVLGVVRDHGGGLDRVRTRPALQEMLRSQLHHWEEADQLGSSAFARDERDRLESHPAHHGEHSSLVSPGPGPLPSPRRGVLAAATRALLADAG